jgi:hypothetical protein
LKTLEVRLRIERATARQPDTRRLDEARMPTPQLIAAAPTAAGASDGTRRVFVSYSHRDGPMAGDGDLPAAVVRALNALADDQPELGLSPERIFFDRDSLMAGDGWNDRIFSEIQRTDVFLLLVSFNSLTSPFCIKQELAAAVSLGVQVIVPVLLSECTWSGHLVDAAGSGRTLGSFDAVPKDGNGNHVPIKSPLWPDRETALTRTMQQIARRLARVAVPGAAADTQSPPAPHTPERAPAGAVARPVQRRGLPPFLPYLCNQDSAVGDFNAGIGGWDAAQSLLVLVKGIWDDDTEGFLGRLCAKNLRDFCDVQKTLLLEPRPLGLPQAIEGGRLRKPVPLANEVRAALSQALFDNVYRIRSPGDIADALHALQGVQPLLATLPVQADEGSIATLRALLDLIEDVPLRTPLDRLVIAVQVSAPELVDESALRKRFKLERRRRVQVVELAPMQPLDREDVRLWHSNFRLSDRVDQPRLLEHVFGGQTQLRMRPFDRSVRGLLGLAPEPP